MIRKLDCDKRKSRERLRRNWERGKKESGERQRERGEIRRKIYIYIERERERRRKVGRSKEEDGGR